MNGKRGFTLIEVMIALGIFLGALLAIMGLYFQNLRLARMAREEIILAMIQRDIMARNLVVAAARAGQERLWRRGLIANAPTFAQFGVPSDTNPATVLTLGWGIRNLESWQVSSALHWGTSSPAADTDVPLYTGFYFTVVPVVRDFPTKTAADWAAVGLTPGLALEDSQFTDSDGYSFANSRASWLDLDGDGIPETDRGLPRPSAGPMLKADLSPANVERDSPFRFLYNCNNMANYIQKLRVRVMWNIRSEDDLLLSDIDVKKSEDAGQRIFNHTEYYFSVFNPDVVKRWQP